MIDEAYEIYLSDRVMDLIDDGLTDIAACRRVYVEEEKLMSRKYFDGLVGTLGDSFSVWAVYSDCCQIHADRVVWEGEDV